MQEWSKKGKGLMVMDNSVVIVGGGGLRGINGNGKKRPPYSKKIFFNVCS